MKRVVIVGPQTSLGRELIKAFVKKGAKIAVLSDAQNCGLRIPANASAQSIVSQCEEGGAEVALFTGNFSQQSEWKRMSEEAKRFLGGGIDHFCFLHGVNDSCDFSSPRVQVARELMNLNFVIGCFALTSVLRDLQQSKGHLTLLSSNGTDCGCANCSFYLASKRALESFVRSIVKNSSLPVTFIHHSIDKNDLSSNQKFTRRFESCFLDESNVNMLIEAILGRAPGANLTTRLSESQELCVQPPDFDPQSANDLCKALYEKSMPKVKDILKGFKRNPDMFTETDRDGRNAFHYAAQTGLSALVDCLVAKLRKASLVDSTDHRKWTPLHYATYFGHLRVIRHLLRHGSNPNVLTETGMSPLHLLARLEPPIESRFHPFYMHKLRRLIDLGADTNQRNKDWATPIHEAAATGSLKALTLFLKNEGDPHRKTKKYGRTPLWHAVRNGHTAVVRLLLEQGSDPINCFDFAPESMKPLLEEYREKNCHPESAVDDSKKEVVIISCMDDFPSAATQMIKNSRLMKTSKDLVRNNWDMFLFVLRFLTRKIYRTPEQADMSRGPRKEVASRARHGKTLEEATAAFVTNGNPRKMFKLLEDVGRGGFGSVSVVRRQGEKKRLAIKKVPHLTEKEQWSNLDEIYFLKQCSHTCIVKYESAYLSRDEMWIVMEYLEGGSLSQTVQRFQLEEGQICYVTREILRGLRSIHKKGFVHRDLKSGNIMLSVQGDIRIIDFGLCAEVDSEEELNGIVGSPFWIPPEMIRKEEHGPPADIWSLGILCLEMAHGVPPHRDSALRAMFNAGVGIQPTFDTPDSWSSDFKDLLSKMLVTDPQKRATADDLLHHPWMQTADTRSTMKELLHTLFVNQSLEKQLGIV